MNKPLYEKSMLPWYLEEYLLSCKNNFLISSDADAERKAESVLLGMLGIYPQIWEYREFLGKKLEKFNLSDD